MKMCELKSSIGGKNGKAGLVAWGSVAKPKRWLELGTSARGCRLSAESAESQNFGPEYQWEVQKPGSKLPGQRSGYAWRCRLSSTLQVRLACDSDSELLPVGDN